MMNITEAISTLNPLVAILLVLGAIGWWRLIARDSLFEKQRRWFWHRFPHEGYQEPDQLKRPKRGRSVWSGGVWFCQKGTMLGELLYCHYCLSWWVALAQLGAYLLFPNVVLFLALAHAGRLAAALFDSRVG